MDSVGSEAAGSASLYNSGVWEQGSVVPGASPLSAMTGQCPQTLDTWQTRQLRHSYSGGMHPNDEVGIVESVLMLSLPTPSHGNKLECTRHFCSSNIVLNPRAPSLPNAQTDCAGLHSQDLRRAVRVSYASVSFTEDLDDDVLQTDFKEYHLKSVRRGAVAASTVALMFFFIPLWLLKLAKLLENDRLLQLFGTSADTAENWADPSCEPSMRKLQTEVGLFSGLNMMFAIFILLLLWTRKPHKLFYLGSFGVAVAALIPLLAWWHVNRLAVLNVELMLMTVPAALHLRTKHSIAGVTGPVILVVIVAIAGQTSPDLCKSAAATIIVMVTMAMVTVFQAAIAEAQLNQLYETSKVHKEQLEEHKHFLKQMLPPHALKLALASTSNVQGSNFDCGTIMMVDVNMEEATSLLTPMALVEGLDRIFTLFDVLIESTPRAVYKVETVGSVYMVAAGVPFEHPDHAHMMVDTALQFLDTAASLCWTKELKMKIRCGVHSGNVFAGVPGMVCPRYRYFGDTVNTAARLESKAPWNSVWVSEATMELLRVPTNNYLKQSMHLWRLVPLGKFWFKGKGNLPVFEVELDMISQGDKVLVSQVENDAVQNAEQLTVQARQRMSALLAAPSLKLRASDRTFFASNSTPMLAQLGGWVASMCQMMWGWKVPRSIRALWVFWSSENFEAFRPETVAEDDFRDPALGWLLTFTNVALERHHCQAEAYKRKRVIAASGVLSVGVVVWCLSAMAAAECTSHERGALLLHSAIVVVLAAVLSAPLIKQFQWTVRWWPCISLLILLAFMTWEINMPCGGLLMESYPAQLGISFIWIMLAHSAFSLPFWWCIVSTFVNVVYVVIYAIPLSCDVDARIVWPECEFNIKTKPSLRREASALILPVIIALYTFWLDESRNRMQFVKVLQAHRRHRQAKSVVKSLLPEHVFQLQSPTSDNRMQVNHYIPMVNQLFSDIMGFTSQAAQMRPIAVFEMVATLFGAFDDLTSKLGVLKIETIGDAYWACTGPVAGGECLPEHATALALFGFKMQEEATRIFPLGPDKPSLRIRIGLHSGPVVGGITGTTMPRYHFFGPHVALANQMESLGSPHFLHVTNAFAALVRNDLARPEDWDVISKDTSHAAHNQMPMCELIYWSQVNKAISQLGKNLRLEANELALLTPVATITRQRGFRIRVQLAPQGEQVIHCFLTIESNVVDAPEARRSIDVCSSVHRVINVM